MIHHRFEWHPKVKSRPRFGGNAYTDRATREAEAAIRRQWPEDLPPLEDYLSMVTRFTDRFIDVYLDAHDAPTTKGKRGDLDNYQKLVQDALNGKAYVDDRQIVHLEASWR